MTECVQHDLITLSAFLFKSNEHLIVTLYSMTKLAIEGDRCRTRQKTPASIIITIVSDDRRKNVGCTNKFIKVANHPSSTSLQPYGSLRKINLMSIGGGVLPLARNVSSLSASRLSSPPSLLPGLGAPRGIWQCDCMEGSTVSFKPWRTKLHVYFWEWHYHA